MKKAWEECGMFHLSLLMHRMEAIMRKWTNMKKLGGTKSAVQNSWRTSDVENGHVACWLRRMFLGHEDFKSTIATTIFRVSLDENTQPTRARTRAMQRFQFAVQAAHLSRTRRVLFTDSF